MLFLLTKLSSDFECLPNGGAIPGVPRGKKSSFSDRQHYTDKSLFPARPNSPDISLHLTKPSLHATSRSPSTLI